MPEKKAIDLTQLEAYRHQGALERIHTDYRRDLERALGITADLNENFEMALRGSVLGTSTSAVAELSKMVQSVQSDAALAAITKFDYSPSIRAVLDMQATAELVASDGLLRTLGVSRAAVTDLLSITRHAKLAVNTASPIYEAMLSAASVLDKSALIQAVDTSSYFNEMVNVADWVSQTYGDFGLRFAAAEAFTKISDAEDIPVLETCEQKVTQLQKSAASPAKSFVSSKLFVDLIVAYGLFMLSQAESAKMEGRIMSRLDSLESDLERHVEIINSPQDGDFFAVKARLNLRDGPGLTYRVKEVLPKNLLVKGLREHGEWLEVECCDYENDKSERGWVARRFLVRAGE